MNKKRVVVIGAAGQIGTPLTKSLLKLGHDVKAVVRRIDNSSELKLKLFESLGATVTVETETENEEVMTEVMRGYDTVVVCTPANEYTVTVVEPILLQAALNAGVKRFVPDEFGCHTRNIEVGDGILFDYKKALHEKIIDSGIGYTFFYNGGIFDYFLPNLRFFEKVTTFGKMDLPIHTHDIEDIGYIAALSITDERTVNKCVQMDYNVLTQTKMLDLVKEFYPKEKLEYTHYSEEYIIRMKDEASDEVTAKVGKETDRERWGINNVIYVLGKLASFSDGTLRTSELFPHVMIKKPEEAISNRDFFFDK